MAELLLEASPREDAAYCELIRRVADWPRLSSTSARHEAGALDLDGLDWRPLKGGLASVVNVRGPRLLAIGKREPQVGQLGVGAVLLDQPRHGVAPAPATGLANEGKRRLADIGQDVSGHPSMIERIVNERNGVAS
jgi:hypothetical protein